jgi:hypothetical protein
MIKIAFYFGVVFSGMLMKPRRKKASNEVRESQHTGQEAFAHLSRCENHYFQNSNYTSKNKHLL